MHLKYNKMIIFICFFNRTLLHRHPKPLYTSLQLCFAFASTSAEQLRAARHFRALISYMAISGITKQRWGACNRNASVTAVAQKKTGWEQDMDLAAFLQAECNGGERGT
jgi:hypothetical protein